jgi:hypothetical protein
MPEQRFAAANNALLNPPREPAEKWIIVIDRLSWILPASAAVAGVVGGVAAFQGIDKLAAILSILSGIISAAGVIFTGWSSRIRDGRLAVTHALSELNFNIAERNQSRIPPGFGG